MILDLHQNRLKYFEAVPKSSKLDSLILAFNFIEEIENLHQAPYLTVLDLHNNKIEELPESILDMENLKTLNISNNNMNNLPPRLALLDNLVRIQVEGNPLKSIKSSIRSAKAEDLKSYLRLRLGVKEEEKLELKKAQDSHLPGASSMADPWEIYIREYLQNNQLIIQRKDIVQISEILWDYDELTMVDLSHNAIQVIPDEIYSLSSLLSLRLSYNRLTSLCEPLSQMANLRELELSDNKLGGFFTDSTVIRMESLSYLNLSNTNLHEIPATLKKLPSLSTLHLSHNHIHDIKELCREEFSGLQVVDVSNNKISIIPKAFGIFLTELNFLNVVNNEIGKLPYNLGIHKNLKNLQVDGNPLKSIRRAVIDRGTAGLLQYLADKYNDAVDGGIEEWAVSKKGKSVKIREYEEEKDYENQDSLYQKQIREPIIAGLEPKEEHIYEYKDHLGAQGYDKRGQNVQEKHYGQASSSMFNDPGTSQKDDYFWDGHQKEVKHIHQELAPEVEVPQARNDPFPEEIASTISQRNKKEMVKELNILDAQIRQLIEDIDNNFSLSKRDVQMRRKELHKVQARRNKINNELAE